MEDTRPIHRARRPFGRTAVYVPREVPRREIAWPKLHPRPSPPARPAWWTYLPLAFMGVMSLLYPLLHALSTGQPFSWMRYLGPLLMALGMGGIYPLFQWLSYYSQVRHVETEIATRQRAFLEGLAQMEFQARTLAEQQRRILDERYPPAQEVVRIARVPKYRRKRLWSRGPEDQDFLTLRVGTGEGSPGFTFAPFPAFSPEDEDLEREARRVLDRWHRVSDLPLLLPLTRVGSVLIKGPEHLMYGLLYRVVVDVAVHHSPRVVRVGVIVRDALRGRRFWSWMKWLPHTGVLEGKRPSLLAFSLTEGAHLVDTLARYLGGRREEAVSEIFGPGEALVLIFDEDGALRNRPSVIQLVEQGPQVGVYCLFVGGTVHGVRAEILLKDFGDLRYKAEWLSFGTQQQRRAMHEQGRGEFLSWEEAEAVARELAGLEPPEPPSTATLLPDHLPLAELLARVYTDVREEIAALFPEEDGNGAGDDSVPSEVDALAEEPLRGLWNWFARLYTSSDAKTALLRSWALRRFLHFPIGMTVAQGRLRPLYLNLLPDGPPWHGPAAYHTILIGPTGSGKSEFLKTLIWGAAYQYPPHVLNVFFIDFKGGAAMEDFKFRYRNDVGEWVEEELPHLVGMVTDPEHVDPSLDAVAISRRGIYAIRREMERRKHLITTLGKAKDIWEYNEKVVAARHGRRGDVDPSLPLLPHLLIILDEFSEGLQHFPELEDILDALARLGRSWGMYLILANQKYTRMEKMEVNVGWRIALRMGDRELREFLHSGLSGLSHVGRGYALCVPHGEVQLFQTGYGGLPMRATGNEDALVIYELGPAGREQPVYERAVRPHGHSEEERPRLTQGRYLTQLICRMVRQSSHAFARPRKIYLDPLPAQVSLPEVLQRYVQEQGRPLAFDGQCWRTVEDDALEAPFALVDNFQALTHEVLRFSFHQGAGHLWVLGVADSGKEDVVEAIVLALAHLYTPEQLWIYILDFSDGRRLRSLTQLPHVGAHVLATERERFHRLVRLWAQEFHRRRAHSPVRGPRWLWVLHDFHHRHFLHMEEEAALRLVESLIHHGGRLGLHLLLTSVHAGALRDEEAVNLRPRLLLEMGAREHFLEAGLGRQAIHNLTRRVPGRGFWLERLGDEGREMQTGRWPDWQTHARHMDRAWRGVRPKDVVVMPEHLSWARWQEMVGMATIQQGDGFPVGLDYDWEPVEVSIGPHQALWLVVGPAVSGKTHFLLLWARTARMKSTSWAVWYLATKSPPEAWLPTPGRGFSMVTSAEEALLRDAWDRAAQTAASLPSDAPPMLLLVDDAEHVLPSCPQDSAQVLEHALRQGRLVWVLAFRSQMTFTATMSKMYAHPFQEVLRRAQEERLGLITRPEDEALSLYALTQRRLPREWLYAWVGRPVGRALLVQRDYRRLVQVPFVGNGGK